MVDPEHPDWKVSEKLRSNARALRRNSTDVERVLWLELRGNRLNGANFRRQIPIDNYIADFICHAAKRSAVIEAKGFKVLRFSNLDVIENRAGVLETTAAAIAERAPTLTSPESGRGDWRSHRHEFTLSWLKDHLETDEPLEKLADKLTMIGSRSRPSRTRRSSFRRSPLRA